MIMLLNKWLKKLCKNNSATSPPGPESPTIPTEPQPPAVPEAPVHKERPFEGRRPYGDSAPWNIPVKHIPLHPEGEKYVNMLWNELPKDKIAEFNFRNYSYPVYNAEEATAEYTVKDLNGWGNLHNQKIPFNPDWQASAGDDAQVIILDPETGTEWNLWAAQIDHSRKTITVGNGSKCAGDYWTNNWDDPATQTTGSRGCGINYLAMLVRAWEIKQGKIEHALSMPTSGTSGQEYFAPATKLEHKDGRTGIPEGIRFSLDVTYQEIDDHVASIEDIPQSLRDMIRTLLVALKEYGWFITDTAGGQTWQLEQLASAESGWEELGAWPMPYTSLYGEKLLHPRFSIYQFWSKDRIRAHIPSDQYVG